MTVNEVAKLLGKSPLTIKRRERAFCMSKTICWDEPCFKGYPICCYGCEEYEDCPEACDMAESCRKDEDND